MKKVFSIFLILIMISNITGIAMTTHLCGGYAMATQLTIGHSELDCGMEGMDTNRCKEMNSGVVLQNENCCDNEYTSIQTDDYHFQLLKSTDLSANATAILVVAYLELYSFEAEKQYSFLNFSPPLLEQDINILYQSFLI